MPPKKTETTQGQDGAAAGNATLNPVQMNFLALLMQHTRSKPDIDVSYTKSPQYLVQYLTVASTVGQCRKGCWYHR